MNAAAKWSTNGTFVWVTSDRAEIEKWGEDVSFEPPACFHGDRDGQRQFCESVVRAVNAHADLLAALRVLTEKADAVVAVFLQDHCSDVININLAIRNARAAIARAEGKS